MNQGYLSLGLIGYPVEHSYSAILHNTALKELGLKGEYNLYSIKQFPEGKMDLLHILGEVRIGKLTGLNVTIPHKRVVMAYLDEITAIAKAIGAVNTIFCLGDKLIGDNTDATGFMTDLNNHLRIVKNKRSNNNQTPCALIIGAGGAAHAVSYILAKEGWSIIIAARRIKQAEILSDHQRESLPKSNISIIQLTNSLLNEINESPSLIVNATSVGMWPNIQQTPWPEEMKLPQNCFVYDLVYNPERTKLMEQASKQGLANTNGIGMLIEQAALSFKLWTGYDPPRIEMRQSIQENLASGNELSI